MHKFAKGFPVKHVKTGNVYRIIATPEHCRIEATNEPAYGYQLWHDLNAVVWIRPQTEMEDGRFVFEPGMDRHRRPA